MKAFLIYHLNKYSLLKAVEFGLFRQNIKWSHIYMGHYRRSVANCAYTKKVSLQQAVQMGAKQEK